VSVCLTLAGIPNEKSSLPGFERTERAAAFSRRKRKKSAPNSAICSCAARMWPWMLLRWPAKLALAAIRHTAICGKLVNFRGASAMPCAKRKATASAFITVRRTDSGRRYVVRQPPLAGPLLDRHPLDCPETRASRSWPRRASRTGNARLPSCLADGEAHRRLHIGTVTSPPPPSRKPSRSNSNDRRSFRETLP
jgi:hypothetical protein